jgi:hypothetical protein
MSDLNSRLLAAVLVNPETGCCGVTALNSLHKSCVTPPAPVTPELSNEISFVTPSHAKSVSCGWQQQDCTKAKENLAPAPNDTDTWGDTEEERAAIVEHDGGIPRAWAEGFARLDPGKAPADVSPKEWLRFIDDCGCFLDAGWAARAAAFGWGSLDLFGCDRERSFARLGHHMGLLSVLSGGTIVELHRDKAIIETQSGARQTFNLAPASQVHCEAT